MNRDTEMLEAIEQLMAEEGIIDGSLRTLMLNAHRVDDANRFAYEHLGKLDRADGLETAYDHAIRVSQTTMRSPEWIKASQDGDHEMTADITIVAVLHDVVEDTKVTVDEIRDLFGNRVAEAVRDLTHEDGEPYHDVYLRRVEQNEIARVVKRADMADNISTAPYQSRLFDKYARAFAQLAEPF